jgi:P27 family predicted phage terminase small subunit
MRGRRPKPTAIKELEGNPGKRPLNRREPRPMNAIPTCPSHLSPTAKAEWKRIAGHLHILRIISQLDRAALAAYCQAYGRWAEAEKKLKETAPLIKTPSGYVQQNPWLQVANKQLEIMHKYLSEFGMTPASRSRVNAMPSLMPKPWEFDDPNSKFAGLLGPLSHEDDDTDEFFN